MSCIGALFSQDKIGDFLWPAEHDAVAAIDFLWNDAQTLWHQAAEEICGEESIVSAENESGWNLR